MRYVLIVCFILTLYVPSIFADGLGTLARLGRSQTYMDRAAQRDAKIYHKLKEAITSGAVKLGDNRNNIEKKYGKPAMARLAEHQNLIRAVYMPVGSTHFKGEKILLFYDQASSLIKIDLIS